MHPAEQPDRRPKPDPSTWLAEHGDALYRYALLRLGDKDAAEDCVQETLLAALNAYERFEGRAAERTWLIGILKNKIVDHIRKAVRMPEKTDLDASREFVSEQFNQRGLWDQWPARWGASPSAALEQQEFWDVLLACLQALPPRLLLAFSEREMEGRACDEICKLLNVTATNLWTLLHRARTRLRRCLEVNWFTRKRS